PSQEPSHHTPVLLNRTREIAERVEASPGLSVRSRVPPVRSRGPPVCCSRAPIALRRRFLPPGRRLAGHGGFDDRGPPDRLREEPEGRLGRDPEIMPVRLSEVGEEFLEDPEAALERATPGETAQQAPDVGGRASKLVARGGAVRVQVMED